MSDVEKQESQKTVVAFVAGLLIGGLLVWVFSDHDNKDEMHDEQAEQEEVVDVDSDSTVVGGVDSAAEVETEEEAPELPTGEGSISVANQTAGSVVTLGPVVYPNDEGWMGVRDYNNGQLSGLLGVARFSKEQGLIPTEIELLRATAVGQQYAVVFYSESGDRKFQLADDVQLEDVVAVFTAQ